MLIRCDGCGVDGPVPVDAKGKAAEIAREACALDGWTVAIRSANPQRGERPTDLCPECARGRRLIDVLTPEACAGLLPGPGPEAVDMRRADW